jgi:tRNA 2-selenouridine synthase
VGDWAALVETLLTKHYDPAYEKSLGRNYIHIDKSKLLKLKDISSQAFEAISAELMSNNQVEAVNPLNC